MGDGPGLSISEAEEKVVGRRVHRLVGKSRWIRTRIGTDYVEFWIATTTYC